MADDDVIIEHPNREKSGSKATKSVVVLLMLITAGLVTIITIGGWDTLQGAKPLQLAYIALYLILAYYIARWRSGMLPVAAALAIVLLIFAAVAGPEWFARDKDGFTSPTLDESVLGLLTLLIVPVQVLVIGFAMQGFAQQWQVEVERHPDGTTRKAQPA